MHHDEDEDRVFIEYKPGFDETGASHRERLNNIVELRVKGRLPEGYDTSLPACLEVLFISVTKLPSNLELPACKSFRLTLSAIREIPKRMLSSLQKCELFSVLRCPRLSLSGELALPSCRYFCCEGIKTLSLSSRSFVSGCLEFSVYKAENVAWEDTVFLKNFKTISLKECQLSRVAVGEASSGDASLLVLPSTLDQCLSLNLDGNDLIEIELPRLPRCKEVIFGRVAASKEFLEYAKRVDAPKIYYTSSVGIPKDVGELEGGTWEELFDMAEFTYSSSVSEHTVDRIQTFVLDGWPYPTLPADLTLERCREFTIKNSQIVRLPERLIESLHKNCHTFVLRNNPRFQDLPINTSFHRLEIFDVRGARFGSLGVELAKSLIKCQWVVLEGVGLVVLPRITLVSCDVLNLARNSLTFVPLALFGPKFCKNVDQIYLFHNRFESPEEIFAQCSELPRCTHLDISDNPLKTILGLPTLPECQTLELTDTLPITTKRLRYLKMLAPNAELAYDEPSSPAPPSATEETFELTENVAPFEGVLQCVNAEETFSQEEWSNEFSPDLYIWKVSARTTTETPDRVLCYDSTSLASWLEQPGNIIAKWVETPGRVMDDMGRGGHPSETDRYAQIYDASGTSSYPIYVTLNSTYRSLKKGKLSNVLVGAVKVDRVRVGNLQGTFGQSALHGQLPPVDIYELEVLGKISR